VPVDSIDRSLLSVARSLLSVDRSLLSVDSFLLSVYNSHVGVCRCVLRVDRRFGTSVS